MPESRAPRRSVRSAARHSRGWPAREVGGVGREPDAGLVVTVGGGVVVVVAGAVVEVGGLVVVVEPAADVPWRPAHPAARMTASRQPPTPASRATARNVMGSHRFRS